MLGTQDKKAAQEVEVHSASFRDTAGFVFRHKGTLYRQVNPSGAVDYEALMSTGLYHELARLGWLVSHEEPDATPTTQLTAYKIIRPHELSVISYPYEWCFGQLKDAALLTLDIQLLALKFGMSLKDASAYNIQYDKCRPILIDTLSFEIYEEGAPWPAYRQFCSHFLAPLALMAKREIRLGKLSQNYINGIPLDLASKLLPIRTYLNPSLLAHLHLHAKTQQRYASGRKSHKQPLVSKIGLTGLLTGLRHTIEKLCWSPVGTQWADYYESNNYSNTAFEYKRWLVDTLIAKTGIGTVWDIGANSGTFSEIAARYATDVLSFDSDPAAVEQHYSRNKTSSQSHCLPLVMDITSPTPAIGWAGQERESLAQRGPANTIMMLAIIHHLVLSNNTPIVQVRDYTASLCRFLIIEFVPLDDIQAQRLVRGRDNMFGDYNKLAFETVFSERFDLLESATILGTDRVIYLMKKRM